MADTTIPVPTFNLGFQGSEVFGNIQDADDFLSGTTDGDTSTKELIDPKKEALKKEVKETKETPKEEIPTGAELVNDLLGEEPKEEETIETEEKETSDENQFKVLSAELYKAGVFTSEEGEEEDSPETPEDFLARFNHEKQKGASIWLENYLGRFGDDRKELFDAIYVNGVDPKEYLPVYNDIENLDTLDLEIESNQEALVRQYYKDLNWPEDKISAKIDKLKSYADLEEEAKTVHPVVLEKKKESLETMRVAKAEEQERQQTIDREYQKGISTLLQEKLKDKNFDGIPLTEEKAKKAFDALYNKKWRLASGELVTDFDIMIMESKKPENISKRIKMMLLAQDNFDFSKIEKKAISKESNTLFSGLAQKSGKKSNIQSTVKNSWQNL